MTSGSNNYAIRQASMNGHIEIVRLLLKDGRVDPSDLNNWAIREASIYGHTDIVKLLLDDPRVRKNLTPEEIEKYKNI